MIPAQFAGVILRKTLLSATFKRLASSTVSSNENHYDIIIAGGGMVGSTLACTLAKNSKLSNRRILLLEASKDFNWTPTEKYSNRVVALNPNTRKLLDGIGAWKHIEAVRYAPVLKLQVWDAMSNSMITFNNEDDSKRVAYIVENHLIIHAVNTENKTLSNLNIVNEARIKNCALPIQADEKIRVELESGTSYTCELLLGCDGVNSKVREAMGVQYLHWSYNQTAMVATLNLSEDTEENVTAWQRHTPAGIVAVLPLTTKQSSLVWHTTPSDAKRLIDLPPDQFIDELNSALWKEYKKSDIVNGANKFVEGVLRFFDAPPNFMQQLPPRISSIDERSRASFPLAFGHSANYVRKGVALVGDAAHRVHPLGGQGVNLGFGDVTCLNEILGEAAYSGRKLGSLMDLSKYETERQRHNVPTMLALDGIQKLYATQFTPVVLLRSIGLQITHALSPVKRAIIQQASN
ncbi:putative ubiquinone biosynthesis monooxygenase [Trypoxylus dichotomus]